MSDQSQRTPTDSKSTKLESTTWRLIVTAFAAGAGAFAVLIVLVFTTGQTFGQRCERMFPADPIAQDRCVERLAHGR